MLKCSIRVDGFPPERLITGKDGKKKYLPFVIYENDEPDQYGNTHVIKEDISKEERDAGKKARIIGNAKAIGQRQAPRQQQSRPSPRAADPDLDADEEDKVPF